MVDDAADHRVRSGAAGRPSGRRAGVRQATDASRSRRWSRTQSVHGEPGDEPTGTSCCHRDACFPMPRSSTAHLTFDPSSRRSSLRRAGPCRTPNSANGYNAQVIRWPAARWPSTATDCESCPAHTAEPRYLDAPRRPAERRPAKRCRLVQVLPRRMLRCRWLRGVVTRSFLRLLGPRWRRHRRSRGLARNVRYLGMSNGIGGVDQMLAGGPAALWRRPESPGGIDARHRTDAAGTAVVRRVREQ